MPKIFELFGYHVEDKSRAADECRKAARCPFMDCDCDGGGNRYLSQVDLKKNAALKKFFPNRVIVASGVCSLQLRDGERPWIVCPRRLLYVGRNGGVHGRHQSYVHSIFLRYAGFKPGTRIGVWPELKIKYKESARGSVRSFDYTFDYVVMPVGKVAAADAAREAGRPWQAVRSLPTRNSRLHVS